MGLLSPSLSAQLIGRLRDLLSRSLFGRLILSGNLRDL